jgi:diguanylate cyclase (GGDEF)-like protein
MSSPAATLLIVDDEIQNRKLLEALLRAEGYSTVSAADGEEALAAVALHPPDLILLDIMMPGMDGYQVAVKLKASPATSNIPIIMVSALIDRGARLAGLNAGAEEFLTKPVDRIELSLRVRNLLRLKAFGDFLQDHSTILEQQVQERTADLHHMAHYDALTGLPNRTLFHESLANILVQATEHGWLVAVLCIDLDHFKNVNDTLGHAMGDDLLRQFSGRLVQCVRIRDTVGRLGGDEFALIVVLQGGKEDAARIAAKIHDALRAPFNLKGHEVSMTASIGVTIHPNDAADPDTLMKYADTAMYRSKHAGRDAYRFFTPQMNAEVQARLELETALRRAIENDEFVLHYQPKVQLESGRIAGVEALLRWQRPGHGLVGPREFIPLLEETGLIVRVGSWVIATACRQIGEWMRSPIGPMQVSVNVSGRQFVEGDLDGDVTRALEDNGIAADLLELELTESSLMANTERTIVSIQGLKARGVQISVDDFGTGYSSLAYLRRFPIDKLKIDIAFVRDITSNPDDAAIALAIIRMAHSLKLEVIAEGVETAAQLAYLRRHGCDHMQGFYFSPPVPSPDVEHMVREGKRLPRPHGEASPLRRTLLLVDDEADILAELGQVLHEDDYEILSAQSPAEGFELLALHRVHVVLCDQRMPAMSGTDFLERVKDLYPDTIRIVLSGYMNAEPIMRAINGGTVHRYYTKPWNNKVLRNDIREAFRQHRPLGDPVPERGAAHAAP